MEIPKNLTKLLLLGGLALGFSARASADTTWVLNDVTFSNGNSATGFFTTNDATNAIDSFSIVVSGPDSGDAFTVTQMVNAYLPSEIGMANGDFSEYVDLYLAPYALTSAGGIIPISSGYDCPGCGTLIVNADTEVIGTAPEPATGGLMLLGFGLMMKKRITQRRRRSSEASQA